MDAVYVVRPGELNGELRASIRSLVKNLDFDKLIIVGHCPSWLKPDLAIKSRKQKSKYRTAEDNLRLAVDHPEVSDPFYYFNDDFFLMQRIEQLPLYSLGLTQHQIEKYKVSHGPSLYTKGMEATDAFLRDISMGMFNPLSFEVHAPILLDKEATEEVLDLRPQEIDDYHWRTVYGNLYGKNPLITEDFKVYRWMPATGYEDWPILSTSDLTFRYHPVGKYIRAAFSTATAYEAWV